MLHFRRFEAYGSFDEEITEWAAKFENPEVISITPLTLAYTGGETSPGVLVVLRERSTVKALGPGR